ncbi:MAG: LacI family DNA-binding transcriptional regulator, partial [Acidimicrobiia bacterium]|nr:LacI family DNA-binding transcriptional regulator [Acidimicrobiia bacterium]
MSNGHPTIHDVAKLAGVSKSLVSLVMRDAPQVSDARRAAVKKAAAELGYRPNAAAKHLVQGRTFVIGVVVADLHNPFYADMVDSIEKAASAADYRILIGSGFQSAEREAVAVDTFLQFRVDGLILTGSNIPASDIEKASETVPVVLASRSAGSDAVDSVVVDDRAGAILAVEHLIDLGHRRIAHIHGGEGSGALSRRAGYESAMQGAGLGKHIVSQPGNHNEQGGMDASRLLLASQHRPTAIFASNDLSAFGVLSVAKDHGLRVPEDLSVIGFDNTSMSRIAAIDLTTIDQRGADQAASAVSLLLERFAGRTEP